LQHHGKIQKGQRVLITGGSGGVGVHAIQIARILGAEVVTTTTNPAKEKLLKDLGAGEVLIGSSGFEKSASIQEL
jgi:NADPH:quinone reductase-like Zn-dependent oxidoreductase